MPGNTRNRSRNCSRPTDDDRLQRGNVTFTIKKARESLHKTDHAYAELLTWCAYLAPDAIPDRIFRMQAATPNNVWQVVSPELLECVRDDARWNRAVTALDKIGMLTGRDAGKSLSVHRTTQAALRALEAETDAGARVDDVCALVCAAYDHTAPDKWDYMADMLPHLLHCDTECRKYGVKTENAGHVASRAGNILKDRGQYARAAEMFDWAEGIFAALPGADGTNAAIMQYEQAKTYTQMGRYSDAIALLEQVLAFNEAHWGVNHDETGKTLHALAMAHGYAGQNDKAETLYRRALSVKEAIQATETPDYATTLYNFAELLNNTEREVAAWEMYEQALAIERRVLPPNHPSLGNTLSSMGRWKQITRMYEDAQVLFEQALAIKRTFLPVDHRSLSITEEAYAELLRDMKL